MTRQFANAQPEGSPLYGAVYDRKIEEGKLIMGAILF